MAHGDARVGTWRGNMRVEWVACSLHTTSEPGVSSITTADAHISLTTLKILYATRDLVGNNNNNIANCIFYLTKKSNQPEDGS